MQSEISLIAVLLLMLIADLILNESRYKARRNIACGLLIAHIILNLVPYTADAFGGMYHNTTMTSVVKTLLTMGLCWCSCRPIHGFNAPIPVKSRASFMCLRYLPY